MSIPVRITDPLRMTKKPTAKSDAVSDAMRRMPTRSTGPEIAIRKELFKRGLRYRVQYPVPGYSRRSIDIAFPGTKVAVFIDGCFWHGCKAHRNIPEHNRAWWEEKIESNRARDRETDAHLRTLGWEVLRYWEHDSQDDIIPKVIQVVLERKTKRRDSRERNG